MPKPLSFARTAQGLCVTISEPSPRWCGITSEDRGSLHGLRIEDVEALHWALGEVLKDVERSGERG